MNFIKGWIKFMKKFRLILIIIAVILSLGYFSLDYLGKQAGKISVEEIDFTQIPDGDYIGKYEIKPVSVVTNTTVMEGKVIDIKLIEHFNGLGKEGEKVIPIILEEQSLKVDVISGATTSSMAIIKSVETSLEERNE